MMTDDDSDVIKCHPKTKKQTLEGITPINELIAPIEY